jgi:WXXGXW repeat (2 copies)
MRVVRSALTPILLALALIAAPKVSVAQIAVGVNITIDPPELPDYDQPEIPGPGYIWVPGYWAWGDDGYYWVPGTWILPPAVGLLWTPGYWGFRDGFYVWNEGYWGPHIGFYGGINYGFGYVGTGYLGGAWRGGVFTYNSAVNNFGSVHITNVYNQTIVNNVSVTKVSFNGGPRGLTAQPNAQEMAAMHENHVQATATQMQNMNAAKQNKAFYASVNQGKPNVAATNKPGQFTGHGVIAAHSGGNYHGGTNAAIQNQGHNANVMTNSPGGQNQGHNANVMTNSPGGQNQGHNPNAMTNSPGGQNQGHFNNPSQPHPNTAHTPPNKPPPNKKDKKG